MWTAAHSIETSLPVDAVWSALADLHTGAATPADGDVFVIHGPLAVGTELDVTPQGQDTFRSRIIELVEHERYADVTTFGDVDLTFRYVLEPVGERLRVTHELVIDGPGADTTGPELGPQITSGFPASLEGLVALAGERVGA